MSIVKNAAFNLILTISSVLFPFLIIPYITRVLSVNVLGKVMYADAISQYLIVFTALGIPFYGVREIAKLKANSVEVSNIVIELIVIQLVISVASCGLFALISPYIGAIFDKKLFFLCVIFVISNAFLIEWFYQGIQDFKYITVRSVILKILSLALIFFLVKNVDDGFTYYAILTFLCVSNSLINIIRFFKVGYLKPTKLNFVRHFKPLVLTFGINFSISVYAMLDTLILGYFAGVSSVGYYTISLKIVKIFWLVINAFGIVLVAHTSRLIQENRMEVVEDNISKALNTILTFSIPFIVVCQLFPVEILTIVGGDKYGHAAYLLRILSFLPLIIGVCNVYGTQFLMVYNKEKYVFRATIMALVVSISVNFLLVPYFKEIGTGVASVTAELVVCGVIIYYASKHIKNVFDIKYFVQVIISSMIMVIFWIILKGYLAGYILLLLSLTLFVVSSIFLQIIYFKHTFLDFAVGKILTFVKR